MWKGLLEEHAFKILQEELPSVIEAMHAGQVMQLPSSSGAVLLGA